MTKNQQIKANQVEELKEKIGRAQSIVLVDYRGINVIEVTALRNEFRKENVEYAVIKNSLIERALEKLGMDLKLEGPTAIAFGYDDAVAPARIIHEFIKKDRRGVLSVKSGIVDGQAIDAGGVKALADLPPKEILIARVMGSLNAPVTNLVGVLSATLRSLVYAIEAVRKSRETE